jgi:hypothetical protein
VWRAAAAVPAALLGPGYGPNGNVTTLEVERYRFCGRPGAGAVSPNGNVWNCLLRRAIDGADIVPGDLSMDGVPLAPLPPPLLDGAQ